MLENKPQPPNGFETKPVGNLSLDSETRDRIITFPTSDSANPVLEASGSKIHNFLRHNKFYIAAAFFGVILVTVVLIFVFRGSEEPKEANIDMQIQVPEQIPSNAETIIKVTVTNKDSQSLVNPQMEIVYPEGFRFVTSTPSPANITGSLFSFGDIAPGQSPTILIKIRVDGGIGEAQKIVAKLRYKYENFSSEFSKESSVSTVVSASGVALNLEGPNIANNSEVVTYTLQYANNTDFSFKNARVEFSYPEGFSFAGATPEPSVGKNIWNLPEVPPGFKATITTSGAFNSGTPGERKTFTVRFLSPDAIGQFRSQAESSFVTAIETLPLLVLHELSEHPETLIATPGDELTYRVRYQNNSTVPARGVNVVVSLNSKAVELNSLRAEGAQISVSTITWNAASFSNLEIVNPGEGGELSFTFEVKSPPVRDSSTNVDIISSTKIKSNEYDAFLPGNELKVKVRSIAGISTALAFFSGELPPKVGKDTIYTASLSATNLTNNFNNCILSAFVAVSPAGFDVSSLAPSLEASRAMFDIKTGKLVWNIGQLKAHTGDFSQPRSLQFNIRINPSSGQAGSEVLLLKNISVSCVDSFTEESVNLTAEDITTGDIGESSSQNGRVVR